MIFKWLKRLRLKRLQNEICAMEAETKRLIEATSSEGIDPHLLLQLVGPIITRRKIMIGELRRKASTLQLSLGED